MASFRFMQVVRQFSSTTAVNGKLVTAPIQLFGTEGRYAHAMYSAATKQKQLDTVEKDLVSFQALLHKDVQLAEFISNPSLKRREKKAALEMVLKKLKYSTLTANLFGILTENGRINKIDGVISAFNKIMSAHRGEVMCTITTAKPLDNASLREVKEALNLFLKKGEVLQLDTKVDPSLIGGMVVTIGDKYVDMSMATKIKTYTNLIQETV
ncbi:ATP synthase subunit O, mitochondrial-like [Gigantopelta aegis]|uniref:ATP synthase subunit O, mitochondrial-like n=1 Tax=Gigantopelta aegis TaxID=1735272 RepID=UPI001B88B1E9|nr:ATP synthase subunit O, mitochondrial-like [Gigantopelta aegis]